MSEWGERFLEDLAESVEEIRKYNQSEPSSVRVTTLSTDEEDDWDGPHEPTYAVVMRETTNGWVATVPDLPGCVATGDWQDVAEANIAWEIQRYLAALREKGVALPKPTTQVRMLAVEVLSDKAWAEEKAAMEAERAQSNGQTSTQTIEAIQAHEPALARAA